MNKITFQIADNQKIIIKIKKKFKNLLQVAVEKYQI